MATSSGLFLATIYNQSQLVERKHVARCWLINTAAMAVPLSAHPYPLVITTKLAAAILGGRLFGGGVLPAQYCSCEYTGVYFIFTCIRKADLLYIYAETKHSIVEYFVTVSVVLYSLSRDCRV